MRAGHVARNTGNAQASDGGFSNTGVIGSVTIDRRPVAESAYLLQVERIAPPDLVGRVTELRELADFCTAAKAAPYTWWRAEQWAGKSALLSWFVLHPPPGVRVVAFFVTARFRGHEDRVGFTDVVMEQLAELLDEPMPAHLTEATREQIFLNLFKRAAERCQGRGERLVLVIDGLDEDRGVSHGPDAYSIAALLPAEPPKGSRIVVAGRPNPPIPSDVPDRHPLRDPRTIRRLHVSSAATVVRADMQRELKRLMYGTEIEQELLGLLTTAGGGLSSKDFAELTDLSEVVVDDHLSSVAGRSFTPRSAHWRPDHRVYVLAHEELQVRAVERLGPRLADYRARLHEWADRYSARGWPDDTPEYLLRGYVHLLRDTGDVDRLIALVMTATRQGTLIRRDRTHTAAIAEIDAVREAIGTSARPDLLTLTRLARRRDGLAVPPTRQSSDGANRRHESASHAWELVDLIDALCSVGDVDRARGLAESIIHPAARAQSLAAVAAADAVAGRHACARALVERAEVAAREMRISIAPTRTYARIARASAAIGDHEQTRALISRISTLASEVTLLGVRAQILAHVACAAATGGQHDQARELISAVHTLADQLSGPSDEWLLALLAKAHLAAGERRQAESLLGRMRNEPSMQTVIALVEAAAAAGDYDKAEEYVRTCLCPAVPRARALAAIAEEAALADDYQRAGSLVADAENALHGVAIVTPSLRTDALAALATVANVVAILGRRLSEQGHTRLAHHRTEHARALLAQIFSSSDYWTGLLPTLGLIDRSLLSAVADDIIQSGERVVTHHYGSPEELQEERNV
ncbi:hypothetical protein OHA18_34245 [Kribbella sp. NBC_00709]|uniref:hypothetical protein n=1 Tax=Kribbella sp. NBC_00709 TaxID=2975972 RepID=UPI002E2C5F3E|nr:hypothetical protein [Kribbella sp. NBC_00709]